MRIYLLCCIAIIIATPRTQASIYNRKQRAVLQPREREISVNNKQKRTTNNILGTKLSSLQKLLEKNHYQHQSHKSANKTQLAELTRSFEKVLYGKEVDTTKLMQACHKLARATRNTGNKAVARDMESNIRKVEALCSIVPLHHRQSMSSLLRFESETGIHSPGGILRDPSAAVGFLWIRRSIAFQSEMYKQVLENPQKSPKLAALDAYKSQLEPYHNWTLQKLYHTSLKAMPPPRKDMLARMGGFDKHDFGDEQEEATLEDLNELLDVWQPILAQWRRLYEELDLEDTRRV